LCWSLDARRFESRACVSHCVLRIYLYVRSTYLALCMAFDLSWCWPAQHGVRREESQQGGIKCEFTIYAVLQHTHNYPNYLTQLPHGERGCVLATKSQSHMKNERTDDMMTWTKTSFFNQLPGHCYMQLRLHCVLRTV
jgi:hypothetical protein